MIKSTLIPERMRRLMAPEQRKEMKLPTSAEVQAKLDGKREKELQENIAALLRQRRIWFERKRMDRRTTGTVGCPDFLFAVKGQAVAFEVKLMTGRVEVEQDECMSAMSFNGWSVWVIRSEQMAIDALNFLEVKP